MKSAGIVTKGAFNMPLYPILPVVGIVFIISFFFGFPRIALSAGIGVIIASLIAYYALREDRDEPIVRVRFFK